MPLVTEHGLLQINNPGNLSWVPSSHVWVHWVLKWFGDKTHFNRFLFSYLRQRKDWYKELRFRVKTNKRHILACGEYKLPWRHHTLHLQPHTLRKAILYADVNRERNLPEILFPSPSILKWQKIKLCFMYGRWKPASFVVPALALALNHRGSYSVQGPGGLPIRILHHHLYYDLII